MITNFENDILFDDATVLESRNGNQNLTNPLAHMVNDCTNYTGTPDADGLNTTTGA